MNKAIFLDRDGVINRKGSSYYIYRKDDFQINDGVPEALRYFTEKGYILVVITNQGGIARGIYTHNDTGLLHDYMKSLLQKEGIGITAIYYCPHHPDIESCDCRKPGNLLFSRAIQEHEIDPALSFMIGDSPADIEAAQKSGIRGILIPVNGNMYDLIVKKNLI